MTAFARRINRSRGDPAPVRNPGCVAGVGADEFLRREGGHLQEWLQRRAKRASLTRLIDADIPFAPRLLRPRGRSVSTPQSTLIFDKPDSIFPRCLDGHPEHIFFHKGKAQQQAGDHSAPIWIKPFKNEREVMRRLEAPKTDMEPCEHEQRPIDLLSGLGGEEHLRCHGWLDPRTRLAEQLRSGWP